MTLFNQIYMKLYYELFHVKSIYINFPKVFFRKYLAYIICGILCLLVLKLNFYGKKIEKSKPLSVKIKPILRYNDCLYNVDKVEIKKIRLLEKTRWSKYIKNGYYKNNDAILGHSFAIIIPFRNRTRHLRKFLEIMHPLLQKQNANYQIFVVEQANYRIFNKGFIMNVGYKIINNLTSNQFDCFIFHDVDVFPKSSKVIYRCSSVPYHLAAHINVFKYEIIQEIVGAAFAVTRKQFEKLNGYSNLYEGWGGEDDDMYKRVFKVYNKLGIPTRNQRFYMLQHKKDVGNPPNPKRLWFLKTALLRYNRDGLNNIIYTHCVSKQETNLVTWIRVDIPDVNTNELFTMKIRNNSKALLLSKSKRHSKIKIKVRAQYRSIARSEN